MIGATEVTMQRGRRSGLVLALVFVAGVAGAARFDPADPNRIVYLTQTTLSLDDTAEIVGRLKERFPAMIGPPAQDICYATENRQLAVKAVAPLSQLLLVVGSKNSSNSIPCRYTMLRGPLTCFRSLRVKKMCSVPLFR